MDYFMTYLLLYDKSLKKTPNDDSPLNFLKIYNNLPQRAENYCGHLYFIPEDFALANKPERLLINVKRDVKALRAWLGTQRRLMPKSFTQKFWMHFTNNGQKLEIFTEK